MGPYNPSTVPIYTPILVPIFIPPLSLKHQEVLGRAKDNDLPDVTTSGASYRNGSQIAGLVLSSELCMYTNTRI